MQSIQHQSEKHFLFATVLFFKFSFCFSIAKRTMVLYNLNMVHLICKAYSKYNGNHRKIKDWYMLLLMVLRYIWVFSLIHPVFCIYSQAICSELNLKLTYGIGRHYLLWLYTHMLCSEQSHCKINQLIFLPPDELWWLNFSVWWPKVIDQHSFINIHLARLTDFVVVIFQLRSLSLPL